MRIVVFAVLLSLTHSVYAADVCKTFDMSAWTQTQKNHLKANAAVAADQQGETAKISRWSNQSGEVCWDTPVTDVSLITESDVLFIYTTQQILRDQARANAALLRQDLAKEEALIDALNSDWDSLTPSEKAQFFKGAYTIRRLRKQLGMSH